MIPFAIQDSDFVSEESYMWHFAREAAKLDDKVQELYKLENPNRQSIKTAYIRIVKLVVLPREWLPEVFSFSNYLPLPYEQGSERRLRFFV